MWNFFTHSLRKRVVFTLVIFSFYILSHVYISFMLLCREGSRNCSHSGVFGTYRCKDDADNNNNNNNYNINSNDDRNNKTRNSEIINNRVSPLYYSAYRSGIMSKTVNDDAKKEANLDGNQGDRDVVYNNKWRNNNNLKQGNDIEESKKVSSTSLNSSSSSSSLLLLSNASSSSSHSNQKTVNIDNNKHNNDNNNNNNSHETTDRNYYDNNDKSQKIKNNNDKNNIKNHTTTTPTNITTRITLIKEYHWKTMENRQKFNCPAVINGSQSEINKILDYHKTHRPPNGRYPVTDPIRARAMLQDCPAFKRIRGYVTTTHSPTTTTTSANTNSSAKQGERGEDEGYSIAYVILAHMDFDHLERLLHALYRPQHVFCIHLDKKVKDDLKLAVSGLASCFPNVILASEPQSIIYAHMSRLMADIGCMKDLLRLKVPWKYLINTAATALPLRTNGEMVQILKVLNGKNDIHEVFNRRVPARWKVEFVVYKGKMRATDKLMSPPPHNLTILKGQAYNTYSREFLQWAMTDQRAKDLLQWSAKTYSPDEHYWATLNDRYYNSALKAPGGFTVQGWLQWSAKTYSPDEHYWATLSDRYYNSALKAPGGFTGEPDRKGYITMLAVWANNQYQGHKCQGRNVHSICLFGAGDLSYISKKVSLTTNKFDLGYDPVAYACMEDWLETRAATFDPDKFDLKPYQRLRIVWYDRETEERKLKLKLKLKEKKNERAKEKNAN